MMKRTAVVYGVCILLLTAVMLRLCWIGWGEPLVQAGLHQSSFTLEAGRIRGGIYDCRLVPLVDCQSRTVTAVIPSQRALTLLEQAEGEDRDALLEQLGQGRPFLWQGELPAAPGVYRFELGRRYTSESLAPHVIGYLDSAGKGVAGVEAACGSLLEDYGWACGVSCPVDAMGRALGGQAVAYGQETGRPGGVVLTLHAGVQQAAEEALARYTHAGAAVVMEAATGRLLAVASLPDFDPGNVAQALQQQDAPLVNRAFSAYNVGSLFKLAVAAAALEEGFLPTTVYECTGSVEVEGRLFHCHHRAGHGTVDLQEALEQSCNVYFIKLAQDVGAGPLRSMALRLGFGSSSTLAPGMTSAEGTLTAEADLQGGELANFAFGQGRLTATPLQLAGMIAAIANGGLRVEPRLILGATDHGTQLDALAPAYSAAPVMAEQTAQILQDMMVSVVTRGSGARAEPAVGGAGGKTASAQTGSLDESGSEVVHAWFGGFYPAQNPRWSVVVLCEGGASGAQKAAPVFREICGALAELPEF